jgi:hypothetical protein
MPKKLLRLTLFIFISSVASAIFWLAFFSTNLFGLQVKVAQAANIVTNCSNDSQLRSLLALNAPSMKITFGCGSNPVTITVASPLTVGSQTTIDGGNLVTLSGGGTSRIILNNSELLLYNLTLVNGAINDSGAAIYSSPNSLLTIDTCNFLNNMANPPLPSGGNGYDNGGGAIFMYGSTLSVNNSSFISNTTTNSSGGAIHTLRGNMAVTYSSFKGNKATGFQGGAIYNDGGAQGGGILNIQNSTFDSNSGYGQGGTVYSYMYGGSDLMTITNSNFTNNTAFPDSSGGSNGGALNFGSGKLTVTGSLFANNVTTGHGGAIFAFEDVAGRLNLTIANSTFTGNDAKQKNYPTTSYNGTGDGGALSISGSLPFHIINTTIANNHAGWLPGSIEAGNNQGALSNTIIANNHADDGGNSWNIGSNCNSTFTEGGNNLQYPAKNPNDSNDHLCTASITIADPKLAALADNGGTTQTLALQTGSAAIDTGSDSVCAGTPIYNLDQRLYNRPAGSHCDIGAFEYGSTPSFPTPTPTPTPVPTTIPTTPPAATYKYVYYLPFLANNFILVGTGTTGSFSSFLAFQNPANSSNNIVIQYFDSAGNQIGTPTSTCSNMAAYAECIPMNPFANGAKGTGIIYATQALNVIVAEATPLGGSAYAVAGGNPASQLNVPLALNGALNGFVTQLNLFNAAALTTTATINFYNSDGSAAPAASSQTITLGPRQTFILDQSSTTSNSNLPLGFNGWAQINGTAGSSLVAQVLEQNPYTHFVAIANASSWLTPTTLPAQLSYYMPAVFDDAYGSFTTGANIINPSSVPLTVSITYYKQDGTALVAAPFALASRSIQPIYHGSTTNGNGLPSGGLPTGFAGAAVVTVTGPNGAYPLTIVCNEGGGFTSSGVAESGVYSAAASGSSSLGLPVMANNGFGYTTGTTILNVSSTAVSASLQYYDTSGSPQGNVQTFSVAPYASHIFFQGAAGILPAGFYGTAVITQNTGTANALMATTNAVSTTFFYTFSEPSY